MYNKTHNAENCLTPLSHSVQVQSHSCTISVSWLSDCGKTRHTAEQQDRHEHIHGGTGTHLSQNVDARHSHGVSLCCVLINRWSCPVAESFLYCKQTNGIFVHVILSQDTNTRTTGVRIVDLSISSPSNDCRTSLIIFIVSTKTLQGFPFSIVSTPSFPQCNPQCVITSEERIPLFHEESPNFLQMSVPKIGEIVDVILLKWQAYPPHRPWLCLPLWVPKWSVTQRW